MTSLTCACGDAFRVACQSPAVTGGDIVLATALCILAVIVHRMGSCCAAEDDTESDDDECASSTMYS